MANPIRVVALTGVSGTGKTTVAELFKRRNPNTVFLMPSLTREAYQEFGIKNEKEKASLPKDKESDLQQFLLDYFIRRTKEQLRLLRGTSFEYLVVQRSVICYLSYISKDIPVTLYSSHQVMNKAVNWLTTVRPAQVFFPYPAPWMKNGEGFDDGFRGASATRENLEGLALEEAMWQRRLATACTNTANPLKAYDFNKNFLPLHPTLNTSVADRVAAIEHFLGVQTRPNFAV